MNKSIGLCQRRWKVVTAPLRVPVTSNSNFTSFSATVMSAHRRNLFQTSQSFASPYQPSSQRFGSPRLLDIQEELSFAETFSTTSSHRSEDDLVESDDYQKHDTALQLEEAKQLVHETLQLKGKTVSNITIEKAIRNFCDGYQSLAEGEQHKLLLHLATDHGIDKDHVKQLAQGYIECDPSSSVRLEEGLRTSLSPPYIWLFTKVGQLEGGVKFLVDLRANLISATRSNVFTPEEVSALRNANGQLRQLLSYWFTVGFLDIEQVTWDSPCAMLQKVSEYEAVHPMRNWTDLKSRVGPYRRCFVYTHRSMPGEPIVVLHVALTNNIPGSISSVVKHHRMVKKFSVDTQLMSETFGREGEDSDLCTTAIFYSITSTQTGLQGIELGTYLIKQAVRELKTEFPKMSQFSTLSPIPGFRSWLLGMLQRAKRSEAVILRPQEIESIEAALLAQGLDGTFYDDLMSVIKSNHWPQMDPLLKALETPLMRLCAQYLFLEKRRNNALDSVANFHLRNGATLWRINWVGDLSVRGLTNSCGIMVNYRYFLEDLENNSSSYQETHKISVGDQVLQLAKQAQSVN